MATECYSQLGFGFQPKLVVHFAGGELTTDAGLVLVREFDEQLRLSADVVSLRLIRFGGHLPKGGYDVQTDGRPTRAPAAPAV